MSDVKVNIYTSGGDHVGYFLNPTVQAFPEGDYELRGQFFDSNGDRIFKLELNPEILPYTADLREVSESAHDKLHRVYVHRGRQPVMMTGSALQVS